MKLGHGFISGFDWELYPKAEEFLQGEIRRFLRNNKFAAKLAKQMKDKTSTDFYDWIDLLGYGCLARTSLSKITHRSLVVPVLTVSLCVVPWNSR